MLVQGTIEDMLLAGLASQTRRPGVVEAALGPLSFVWGDAPQRQRGGELKMTRETRKLFLVTQCISFARYIGGGVSCKDGS